MTVTWLFRNATIDNRLKMIFQFFRFIFWGWILKCHVWSTQRVSILIQRGLNTSWRSATTPEPEGYGQVETSGRWYLVKANHWHQWWGKFGESTLNFMAQLISFGIHHRLSSSILVHGFFRCLKGMFSPCAREGLVFLQACSTWDLSWLETPIDCHIQLLLANFFLYLPTTLHVGRLPGLLPLIPGNL